MSQAPSTRKPPSSAAATAPVTSTGSNKFTVSSGPQQRGQRIIIHGPSGSGKTTLAALIEKARFIDRDSDGSKGLRVSRVEGIETFDDAMLAMNTPALWEGINTVVVDSGTAFQQLATLSVIGETKLGEKPKSIEAVGGGFGKGFTMVGEKMNLLLANMDRHVEKGRNVVLICHSVTGEVSNPEGDNYLQHQLALMQTKSVHLRTRFEGWADHILFIARDVAVTNGKGSSKGTRAIQTVWSPWWVAKTRTFITADDATERSLPTDIVYYDPRTDPEGAAEVWRLLGFNK